MNDTVRGLVLLFSVLLWLPFLLPTLDGTLSIEQSVLRYAATLLLSWAGGTFLSSLVRRYAEQSEQQASDEDPPRNGAQAPQRRAEDRAA